MGQKTRILTAAAAILMAAAACDDTPCFRDAGIACSVCEAITEPATLEIGITQGEDADRYFVELQNGDDIPIYLNYNGLWASDGAIRVHGMYPGDAEQLGGVTNPVVKIDVFDQAVLAGGGTWRVGLTATDNGAEGLSLLIPYFVDQPISEYLGRTFTLRVQVTDACGTTATDELDVVLICDPDRPSGCI